MDLPLPLYYLAPMAIIWLIYGILRQRHQRSSAELRRTSREAGMKEPVTLHPVIDTVRCIGCGSCVSACPEKRVLGLIEGKAHLIQPANCIGHGACKAACPMHAIELVFGTRSRGVELPAVGPDFQTDVPGIFIAGELGGMGLIRNAMEQGRQAMESIAALSGMGGSEMVDVVIVGAGPAGLAATLTAADLGLRYVTIEQEALGGCVAHYPRGKLVMTAPVTLPMVGKVRFSETTKEELLEFWHRTERRAGLEIRYGERMEKVTPLGDGGFEVCTNRETLRCRALLLAIGRRGTPRKLGVPGEELPKVVYRLVDPEQYRGQRVLVVGGGDSALEAALAIAGQEGSEVVISYRSEAFNRAKPKNRQRIEAMVGEGRLRVLYRSNVKSIERDRVVLDQEGEPVILENDAVIIQAGGVLPTGMLRQLGITVEMKYGTP